MSVPLRKRRAPVPVEAPPLEPLAPARFSWVFPGLVCDCECTNELYKDVLHPVRVLSLNDDGQTCLVLFLAWNVDAKPETEPLSLLSPLAPACPGAHYSRGDRVFFRCWKRKIGTRLVDGLVGNEEGVWVRGTIEKFVQNGPNDGNAEIRHTDWEHGTMTTWSNVRHMRHEGREQLPQPQLKALRSCTVWKQGELVDFAFRAYYSVQASVAYQRDDTDFYLIYVRFANGSGPRLYHAHADQLHRARDATPFHKWTIGEKVQVRVQGTGEKPSVNWLAATVLSINLEAKKCRVRFQNNQNDERDAKWIIMRPALE